MKTTLFISFIILFSIFSLNAQEVQFPASIVAAGGGAGNGNKGLVSKWRIGKVNVLQIGSDNLKSNLIVASGADNALGDDWKIIAYPNPVTDFLQIQFEIEKPNLFGINVTDLSGRKIIEKKVRLIIPNETVELDLTSFSPSLYIIHVCSEDKTINKILKVSKH